MFEKRINADIGINGKNITSSQ